MLRRLEDGTSINSFVLWSWRVYSLAKLRIGFLEAKLGIAAARRKLSRLSKVPWVPKAFLFFYPPIWQIFRHGPTVYNKTIGLSVAG
jgi:hypothetical protein